MNGIFLGQHKTGLQKKYILEKMKQRYPFREIEKLSFDLDNLVKNSTSWLTTHTVGGSVYLKRDRDRDINSVVQGLEVLAKDRLGACDRGLDEEENRCSGLSHQAYNEDPIDAEHS